MNEKDWDDVETLARGLGGADAAAMVRAMRDDLDKNKDKTIKDLMGFVKRFGYERDDARARVRELEDEINARREWVTWVRDERDSMEEELEAARADNAALRAVLRDVVKREGVEHEERPGTYEGWCPGGATCECKLIRRVNEALRDDAHPGEALLSTLEETRCALEVATAAAQGEREAHAAFRARVREVLRDGHATSAEWLADLPKGSTMPHAQYEEGCRDTCAEVASELGLSLEPTTQSGGEPGPRPPS